jgi:DNA-binding GntR family transcriptional regulator
MILDMEIGPGERLTERWAETQVGASRTPVRAALLRLETDGLVKREGRGWMVTPIDVNEVDQLFVYRAALETAAVRLAATRMTPGLLEELEAASLGNHEPASTEVVHDRGTAFHLKLAEACGNEFIRRAVADAITRLSRARWLDAAADHGGWDEHRAIVAALREGNPDLAVERVEKHIQETRERLLKVLRESRRSSRARGVTVV